MRWMMEDEVEDDKDHADTGAIYALSLAEKESISMCSILSPEWKPDFLNKSITVLALLCMAHITHKCIDHFMSLLIFLYISTLHNDY